MNRYSTALAVAAALSALGVGFAQAESPGQNHEMVLRRMIEQAAHGQLDERTLTPELAAAIQPQKAIAQAELTKLGVLKTLTLTRRGADGTEFYLTTFEHGALEWAFAMTADGQVSNAMYRKPTAPAP